MKQVEKLELLGYQVELDRKATWDWYRLAGEWGCECGHCRNFLEIARKKALPERIGNLLDGLGIPAEKATYVGELYTDDAGIHYQFSYRIAGSIEGFPGEEENWGRCCHEPYPYGAPNFPQPHFDLEFWTALPWVLEKTDQQKEN